MIQYKDMNEILLIGIGIVGIVFGYIFAQKRRARGIPEQSIRKAENKEKVLIFVEEKGSVRNADVKKLLNVSDATAERYLNELEMEMKIVQHGEVGQGVFYTPK